MARHLTTMRPASVQLSFSRKDQTRPMGYPRNGLHFCPGIPRIPARLAVLHVADAHDPDPPRLASKICVVSISGTSYLEVYFSCLASETLPLELPSIRPAEDGWHSSIGPFKALLARGMLRSMQRPQ